MEISYSRAEGTLVHLCSSFSFFFITFLTLFHLLTPSGIFLSPPRECSGAIFRKSLKIGKTETTESLLKAQLLTMMYVQRGHVGRGEGRGGQREGKEAKEQGVEGGQRMAEDGRRKADEARGWRKDRGRSFGGRVEGEESMERRY
jgi:hypothetical protein